MGLTEKTWPLREDKAKKLARDATPQKDMPPCPDCLKQIIGVAVAGYDGVFRCLKDNALHYAAVLRESGESAPLPSDESKMKNAAPEPEEARKKRDARVKDTLERYGVTKRT